MNVQKIDLPFDVPLQAVRWLRAGRLTCMYENGNVRYIRLRGDEVVRMIYSAVRDQTWKTASYIIEDEVIVANESAFTITYTATYELNEIHYKASVVIEGKDDTIRFSMKGVALNNFAANRIGLCVLHPIDECAGTAVHIRQPSGHTYSATFPVLISPHQPFKEIREMLWTNPDGIQAQLIFEGDTFETEDQRNWTDASYKTYSRPLDLPYPFDVREGEVMEQTITLKVSGHFDPGVERKRKIDRQEIKVPFPAIGYSRLKGSEHLSASNIELLRKIPFEHYRVELRLDQPGWMNELFVALAEAKQLTTVLELVVFFGNEIEKDVDTLLAMLSPEQRYIKSILPLHVNGNMHFEVSARIYAVLKKSLPNVAIGYGTDGFFAALNRNRPRTSQFDFLSYSINPQAHAIDTRTIVENLSGQSHTLKTASDFAAGKSIHVSPVTFKARSDDNNSIDERLHSYFGAWWTLQTIKNLSSASNITFYETVGRMGILKNNESTHSGVAKRDLLTPIYQVLSAVHAFQPRYVVIEGSDMDEFVVENAQGNRLIFKLEMPV